MTASSLDEEGKRFHLVRFFTGLRMGKEGMRLCYGLHLTDEVAELQG